MVKIERVGGGKKIEIDVRIVSQQQIKILKEEIKKELSEKICSIV
jgi:DNA-binding NtrC family response regulator